MNSVTVFCAVWHRDPERLARLQSHRENLRRQTMPVDVVYVFDGDDVPPAELEAQTISSRDPLTIYQAWNLALASVRTPVVMNLNLDDRLAPDAVEKMAAALISSDSVLVGGDWRICFSQEETDAVSPCFPASSLPVSSAWPPSPGVTSRLGASGEMADTCGPGAMWRMAAHERLPRYPWRFSNGDAIKCIGDALFWQLLRQKGAKITMLPLIVGNYHSHPSDQAEFRHDNTVEWQTAMSVGINSL